MKTTGVETAFSLRLHFEMLPQVSTYAIAFTPTLIWYVAAILLISFLHNFAFNSGTFYLALFYQVR